MLIIYGKIASFPLLKVIQLLHRYCTPTLSNSVHWKLIKTDSSEYRPDIKVWWWRCLPSKLSIYVFSGWEGRRYVWGGRSGRKQNKQLSQQEEAAVVGITPRHRWEKRIFGLKHTLLKIIHNWTGLRESSFGWHCKQA